MRDVVLFNPFVTLSTVYMEQSTILVFFLDAIGHGTYAEEAILAVRLVPSLWSQMFE
jgi:hypothetical protein